MADEDLDPIQDDSVSEETPESETESLDLEVEIASPSACERHVTVTISRGDIDRYLDDAFSELMSSATVPGFRAGRAPRKLVEKNYRKEVGEQIKGSLLMDSLGQISEEQSFTAISEPELNLDALEVPDEGPMVFEFDIEVRPEFEMPEWKGLKLPQLVRDFTDDDVQKQLEQSLSRYAQLAPHDGPASDGNYATVNIICTHDGNQVAEDQERVLRIHPTLSFQDGQLEGFAELMEGAKAGEKRSGQVTLSEGASNEALRGKTIDVEFEVLEIKKLKLPEMTPDFLQEMGDFETEEQLREAIRANLQRQLEYTQQRKIREQITSLLTEAADWELPPGLLKRQSGRELERSVMELRRSGFSEAEIRARENQLQQNSAASTSRSLKEHFVLERIAEEQEIEVEEGDYEKEIYLMAMQSGESPRRVRAQIEKRGLMDVLQNQIIERKVLEAVQDKAQFQDEPYEPSEAPVEAIAFAAGGGDAAGIHDATEDAVEEDTATGEPAEAEVS